MLSKYVSQKLCWFRAIKLFKCQKNTFGIQNTQYSKELSVHKQPSVFNKTYALQSRVNCPLAYSEASKYYALMPGKIVIIFGSYIRTIVLSQKTVGILPLDLLFRFIFEFKNVC